MLSSNNNEEINLEALPDEMLLKILKGVGNLSAVRQACKKLNRISKDTHLSSFFGSIQKNHMVDRYVEKFILSKDNTLLAISGDYLSPNNANRFDSITIVDVESGEFKLTIKLGRQTRRLFAFSESNKIIYILPFRGNEARHEHLCIYDLSTHEISNYQLKEGRIHFLDVQNNGAIVVGRQNEDGEDNSTNFYLDKLTIDGALTTAFIAEDDRIPSRRFTVKYLLTNKNEILAIYLAEGIVKKFNSQLEVICKFEIGALKDNEILVAPIVRGDYLVFCRNYTIEVWDITSGKCVSLINYPELSSKMIGVFDLYEDKQHFLFVITNKVHTSFNGCDSTANDDTLLIFNISSGRLVNTIRISEFPKRIQQAIFMADNKVLIEMRMSPITYLEQEPPLPKDMTTGVNFLSFNRS